MSFIQRIQCFFKLAWIGFAKVFVVAFLSCFFLVPGIVGMCNFAFTEMISFQSPALDTKGVFLLSKELATGHKKEIFVTLLSALGNVFSIGALMFLLLRFLDVFLEVSTETYLIFVSLAILIAAFFIVELCMFHLFERIKKEKIEGKQA